MAAATAALLAAGNAWAQAPAADAQVRRAVELRETPSNDARSLGSLPAQSAVTRTGRQGAWVQVRTAQGATGWVALFDVVGTGAGGTAGTTASGNSLASSLRGFGNALGVGGQSGGNRGLTTETSVAGLRGMDKEDIAKADPNPAALQQAETLRVDGNAARQFAAVAPLASRAVDPLPEPPRPAAGPTGPREAP